MEERIGSKNSFCGRRTRASSTPRTRGSQRALFELAQRSGGYALHGNGDISVDSRGLDTYYRAVTSSRSEVILAVEDKKSGDTSAM